MQFLYTSYASIKVGKSLEYTYNGISVNLKKINPTICNNVDKSRRHDATWNKPDRERLKLHDSIAVKLTKAESNVVTMDREKWEMESWCSIHIVSVTQNEKVLEISHKTVWLKLTVLYYTPKNFLRG